MQTKKTLDDDKKLLAQAQAGEHHAFDLLMPPHISAMRRKLFFMMKGHDDVDDVLQIALFLAWRALPQFRGDCALSTWLYRIAHNAALNYFAERRLKTISLDAFSEDGEPIDPPDSATPENVLEAREECARLAFQWAILPKSLWQALYLYEIEQLSYEQIATIQSVPVGTVRSRIYRARAQLGRL